MVPPCNHYSPEELYKYYEQILLHSGFTKKPRRQKKPQATRNEITQPSTKTDDFIALNKIRMFSPEAQRNRNNIVHPNERNTGFRSNPHTPGTGQRYMNKRHNGSRK